MLASISLFQTSVSDLSSVIICWVSVYEDVWDVGMTGRWQTGLEVSKRRCIADVMACYLSVAVSECVVLLMCQSPTTSLHDSSLQGLMTGHHGLTAPFTLVVVSY